MMNNIKEGHVGILISRNEEGNASWDYCIARHVFDDKIEFLREGGNSYMHVFEQEDNELINDQPTKSELQMLHKNGEPVIAKRKLLGGWKFEIDKSKWHDK